MVSVRKPSSGVSWSVTFLVKCPGIFISMAAMTLSSAPRRRRSGPKMARRSVCEGSTCAGGFRGFTCRKKSRALHSSSTSRRKDPCFPVMKLTVSAGTTRIVRSSCDAGSSIFTGPSLWAITNSTYFLALRLCSGVPRIWSWLPPPFGPRLSVRSICAPLTAQSLAFVLPPWPRMKAASSFETFRVSTPSSLSWLAWAAI
mmetsp:Transcript_54938/g.156227  ORF Transcript_54938/g.156227 Transcript_54938/m.156227 type:complete len:200 (-) Transcript_54938:142-741(-)